MKKGVISIIALLTGAFMGAGVKGKLLNKEVDKIQKMSDKHLALYLMMNQWVKNKQTGKNLEDYFIANGLKEIAIYGMSYAGERLVNELKDSEVKIAYGIDQNDGSIASDIQVVSPDDFLDKVDAIVVTAITYFDEIEQKLREKVDCPIISLENILYQIEM